MNKINKNITVLSFVAMLGLILTYPAKAEITSKIETRQALMTQKLMASPGASPIKGMDASRTNIAVLKKVKVLTTGDSFLTVDNAGTTLKVNIVDETHLRRKFWGKSQIDEFSVGDTIDVIGRWTDTSKTALTAILIRNESIQMRSGVFFGTVKSLTDGGFVMTTIHRDDETVTIGNAKLINRKQLVITQADIKVGDKVRVRGLWNNTSKTITEVREVKDFSLPPQGSGEPEGSGRPKKTSTPAASATPSPTVSPTPTATP